MKTFNHPKVLLAGMAATAILSGLGSYVFYEEHRLPVLEVYIIALKHGQAMFIRTPDDKRILINAGENSEIIRHISKILPFYSRRIDMIIATDTTGKNSGGFIDVTDRYHVGEAYIPGVTLESLGLASTTDPIFKTFLIALRTKKIPLKELQMGDQIIFSDNIKANALFPVSQEKFSYSKSSAPELLLTINYRQTAVSFLGNATKKIQKFIASINAATSSDPIGSEAAAAALIVSSNGSPDNLSAELFDEMKPDYFIYSKTLSYSLPQKSSKQAKKKSNDPSEKIQNGQKINLREKGMVKLISDGQELMIR